ncbi:MAG TPA: hypothetical protein VGU20_20315 [Stellaceae bacterium]|nr:hypothetical protein [Stellaceae bacterium]
MTLITLAKFETCAMVVSDDYMHVVDGEPSGCAKQFSLHHQRTVMTGRGSTGFLEAVYSRCNLSGLGFDALACELPSIVLWLSREHAPQLALMQQKYMRGIEHNVVEVMLAGWSSKQNEPAIYSFAQKELGDPVVTIASPPKEGFVIVAPWTSEMGPIPTLAEIGSVEGVLTVARRQMWALNEHCGRKTCGGTLTCTEVHRDRLVTHYLDGLEGVDELAA